jgi:hypothetical protein
MAERRGSDRSYVNVMQAAAYIIVDLRAATRVDTVV